MTADRRPGWGGSSTCGVDSRAGWLVGAGTGLVGGAVGAVTGGGTGLITVPSLDKFTDLPRSTIHGTATIANIAVAAVGVSVYWLRGGAIEFPTGIGMVIGGVAGAILGARLVARVSERALRLTFVVVLVASGLTLLLDALAVVPPAGPAVLQPGVADTALVVGISVAVGVIVGAWSAALGLGGGLLAVPVLVLLFGLDLHAAVGTSLLVMLPNSVTGAITHLRQATASLPVGMKLAAGAAPGAAGGAIIALTLDERTLTVMFAVFVLLIAGREARKLIQRGAPSTPSTAGSLPQRSTTPTPTSKSRSFFPTDHSS